MMRGMGDLGMSVGETKSAASLPLLGSRKRAVHTEDTEAEHREEKRKKAALSRPYGEERGRRAGREARYVR
jgi:hypothetical protein